MKNLLLTTIAIALIPIFGCGAGTDKKEAEGTDNKTASITTNESGMTASTTENDGKVIHLTKAEFLEKVMNYEKNPDKWIFEGDKPCIIDFYADWCQPCKIAGPILEELAMEYAGKINVYKIDTQKERELAGAFGIQSIPAFLWCPTEGKPQMSNGIARSKEETKQMFKQLIDDVLL